MKAIFVFLFLLLLHGVPLQAESISISGLSFAVDQIDRIDSTSLKVTLFGESRIIANEQLADYVSSQYFSQTQLSAAYSTAALKNFIAAAISEDSAARAFSAFVYLARHNPTLLVDIRDYFVVLANQNKAPKSLELFFKSVLLSVDTLQLTPKALAFPLFFVALADPGWIRLQAASSFYRASDEYKAEVEARFAAALGAKDESRARDIAEKCLAAFSSDDPFYKRIRLNLARLDDVRAAIHSPQLEKLLAAIESLVRDQQLSSALWPIVLDLVHAQAAELLSNGNAEGALRLLSLIELDKRTPNTHSLIAQSLTALQPSINLIISEPHITTFLQLIASNDNSVARPYTALLDREIRFLVGQGKVELSERYLVALTQINPPAPLLNKLKIEQALGYAALGDLSMASTKVRSVSGLMPLSASFRLLRAGIFTVGGFGIVLMAASLLALAIFGLWPKLALLMSALSRPRRTAASQGADTKSDQTQAGFTGFRAGLSPRRNEYEQCLKVFGLSYGATLKQIKTAYRSAVKEVHPDINNQSADPEKSKRFIEVTTVYERLMEIRKELEIE